MQIVQNIDNPDSPEHILTEYVACINCKELYGNKSATATLNRHKSSSNKGLQRSIDIFIEEKSKKQKIVPKELKIKGIEKCFEFCCLDIRPMSAIEGEGLKNLCQFLLALVESMDQLTFRTFCLTRLPYQDMLKKVLKKSETNCLKIYFSL